MPVAPRRPCPHPGCSALLPPPCPLHHRTPWAPNPESPPPRRLSSAAWERRRRAVFARSRLCYLCGAPAGQVDHIVPLAEGGSHAFENLAPICEGCHTAKTAREGARGLLRSRRARYPLSSARPVDTRGGENHDAQPGRIGAVSRAYSRNDQAGKVHA